MLQQHTLGMDYIVDPCFFPFHRPDVAKLRKRQSFFEATLSHDKGEDPMLRYLEKLSPSWHYVVSSSRYTDQCLQTLCAFLDSHLEHAHLLADVKDEFGRKAIDVAMPKVKDAIEKRILFCGRYRLERGAIAHRSATCEVVFGEDTRNIIDGNPVQVALKMMRNYQEFLCEIKTRQERDLSKCVVQVLGWHVPENCDPVPGTKMRKTPSPKSSEFRYILVLERGDNSAFLSIVTQRTAGYDAHSMSHLAFEIAKKTSSLHGAGLVHFDLKLRNTLLVNRNQMSKQAGEVLLCDLDAASPIGSKRNTKQKPGSSGYYAPEVARWVIDTNERKEKAHELVCTAALDVWSFGVILFELCSGCHLFPQDLSNDAMIISQDEMRVSVWRCITDEQLSSVFKFYISCSEDQRQGSKNLIRWCLQGDATLRPKLSDILSHPFILSHQNEQPSLARRGTRVYTKRNIASSAWKSVVEKSPAGRYFPMHYHFFISHVQVEASGDVGTLFHFFGGLGLNCWRDMNLHGDITEEAMRDGVRQSTELISSQGPRVRLMLRSTRNRQPRSLQCQNRLLHSLQSYELNCRPLAIQDSSSHLQKIPGLS